MNGVGSYWNLIRVEKLRQLWDKGLSAREIALELGDITRNAVLGKAHRIGLASRPSPIKYIPDDQRKSPRRADIEASKAWFEQPIDVQRAYPEIRARSTDALPDAFPARREVVVANHAGASGATSPTPENAEASA